MDETCKKLLEEIKGVVIANQQILSNLNLRLTAVEKALNVLLEETEPEVKPKETQKEAKQETGWKPTSNPEIQMAWVDSNLEAQAVRKILDDLKTKTYTDNVKGYKYWVRKNPNLIFRRKIS